MIALSSNGVGGPAADGDCVGEFGAADGGGSGVVATSSSLMITLTRGLLSWRRFDGLR
jgi:hypothetical protein